MITPSHRDWSLHRKGPVDQARHQEKIKEAIRQRLPDIVSEESIITSDGKRVVKVPIRSLDEYRFRFDPNDGERVGQGEGGTQKGDVLGPGPNKSGQGPGKGQKPGGVPGIDYYEAEITIDDLADLIFEDLRLPDLKPKSTQEVPSESIEFTEVRKRGSMGNLDKRRSIREAMLRTARAGTPGFQGLTDDDLRFKVWEQKTRPESAAVVLAMRDASGSMGEFKKYITRSLFFWLVRFLRTKYTSVEIVFITHHSEAQEVDEETFFHLGESGGTRVSSAYQLAADVIGQRYDPRRWNIYPFHFSDGDNWSEADNRKCIELVHQLLAVSNLFGYGEIKEAGYTSTLMNAFQDINDPRFVMVAITERRDVLPALQKWLGRGGGTPHG